MRHKVYPPAARSIKGIWKYTADKWGEDQADAYVHGLYATLDKLAENRMIWRSVNHPRATGVYVARYERHYLFFRALSDGCLGVVSVLHESRDIPSRLREDLDETDQPV